MKSVRKDLETLELMLKLYSQGLKKSHILPLFNNQKCFKIFENLSRVVVLHQNVKLTHDPCLTGKGFRILQHALFHYFQIAKNNHDKKRVDPLLLSITWDFLLFTYPELLKKSSYTIERLYKDITRHLNLVITVSKCERCGDNYFIQHNNARVFCWVCGSGKNPEKTKRKPINQLSVVA